MSLMRMYVLLFLKINAFFWGGEGWVGAGVENIK